MDLPRGRKLRIDGHGKAQLVPHQHQLLGIFGVAHPGNGVLCAQLFCHDAGEQVRLVPAGGGNKQMSVLHTRLFQHTDGRAVAVHHHHIIGFQALLQHLGV